MRCSAKLVTAPDFLIWPNIQDMLISHVFSTCRVYEDMVYIYNIYTYLAGTFGLTVFSTPQWLKLRCYPHLLCWRLVSPALGGFVSVIWDPDSQGFRFQCNHQCSGLSEWLCFLCSNCFLSHLSHLSHEQARGRRWRSWDTGGGLSIFFTRWRSRSFHPMKLFSAPPSVHARRARNGNGHCICFTILKRQLLAETKMSRIGDSRLD